MTKGSDLELGQVVVGKYRLLDVLGEGGMGIVYLSENELIEKKVALKVLRKEYSGKPELVQRFKQEAISASRIKHPNVLDVFDFGQLENGCFFLAMEYLQGHDLADELEKVGVLEPVFAVRLALQMCRALGAAHSRGVVHRDMKPENVFLHRTEDGDDVVKIVDFGIAQLRAREDKPPEESPRRRLTRTGVIFGTPEYMSPEQAAGRQADLRVDIYAMGVILYEMFSGAVPFTGDTFMAVLTAHLTQTVPPLRMWAPEMSISAELEGVILRALAKNPNDRFQLMSELGQALHQTPEGRMAAPLAGLVAIPKVTRDTFRPVRGGNLATSEQFSLGSGTAPLVIPAQAQDDAGNLPAPEAERALDRRTQPEIPSSSKWGWLIAGLVIALAAGVGNWKRSYLMRSMQTSRGKVAPTIVAARLSTQPAATPAGAAIAIPALSATIRNENQVTLAVATEPAGAVLYKGGFQVCDDTPCSLTVDRGEAMELEGRKGSFKGIVRVLAQRDQAVNIVLLPAPPAYKRPTKSTSSKAKLCEVVVDGLKILRPCPQ